MKNKILSSSSPYRLFEGQGNYLFKNTLFWRRVFYEMSSFLPRWLLWNSAKKKRRHFVKTHAFRKASVWINNRSVPQTNDMTRKTTKYCLSWPNKTLEISRRLRNITILLTERTIMSHSNLILPLSPLFYRMWRHFLVDDQTKKVPGVAECSPPPLVEVHNIDRTLRALWLVKNLCFIRVWNIEKRVLLFFATTSIS